MKLSSPCSPQFQRLSGSRTVARRRGVALVLVLAFVVLVTGLFVAFMSRSISDTQVSNGSANLARVDLLSDGAVNSIVGDLQTEIGAGSDAISTPAPANPNTKASKVYLPSRGGNGVASQPFVLPDIPSNASDVPLVKRSARGQPFFAEPTAASSPVAYPKVSTYPASNRAAASSTATVSVNGRSITAQRWNKPLLFSTIGTTPDVPAKMIPDWIVVSRDGSNPTAFGNIAQRKDSAGNDNPTYAVGRYAYMMYDEGALLDANAAGGPSFFSPAQVGAKGSLALADLTQLSTMPSNWVDALVGWRNAASGQTAGSPSTTYSFGLQTSFYDFITGFGFKKYNPINYLSVAALPQSVSVSSGTGGTRTDRMFTGRQELINFLLKGVAQNTADQTALRTALRNLGTFTREVNAPSWMPPRLSLSPTAATTTYASEATRADQANGQTLNPPVLNRNVANVLVQKAFQRKSDGTMAVPGEPLIKHRFPLRLLDAFNGSGDPSNIIRDNFSMRTNGAGLWNFVDIDNGYTVSTTVPHIKTLDEVAQLGTREPTFWELLQAAVLTTPRVDPNAIGAGANGPAGSLGVGVPKTDEASYINGNGFNILADLDSTRQLLAVGLNIIDQYDTDDDPTVLIFKQGNPQKVTNDVVNELTIAGDENLPGLLMLGQAIFKDTHSPDNVPATYKPPGSTAAPVAENYIDGYLQPLMWNPHRNAAAVGTGSSPLPKLRIRMNGKSYLDLRMLPPAVGPGNRYSDPANPAYGAKGAVVHVDDSLVFQLTGGQKFEQMGGLQIGGPTATVLKSESSTNCLYPPYGVTPVITAGLFMGQLSWPKAPDPGANYVRYTENLTISLEKLGASGNWLPYVVIPRFGKVMGDSGGVGFSQAAMDSDTFKTQLNFYRPDPRSARFGGGNGGAGLAGQQRTAYSPWNVISPAGTAIQVGAGALQTQFPVLTASWNKDYRVNDNDGVGRKTDGEDLIKSDGTAFNSPGDRLQSSPFAFTESRPVVLNRPFTSVAEMGYAFRDSPWKSIDFASPDSADGALLDFFTVNDESAVRAGVFNPNNASIEALSAVLRGAYQDPLSPGTGTYFDIPTSKTIATSIYNTLHPVGGTPQLLANRSDLVALASHLNIPSTGLAGSTFRVKPFREAIVRSMVDNMNTRTWNLLIDVVAQTGRYNSATANGSFDKFNVEGERRVWVHLAVDRYTGEVLARQVEPVTE